MKAKRATLSRTLGSVVKQRPSAQPLSPTDNILALVHVFSNLIGRAFTPSRRAIACRSSIGGLCSRLRISGATAAEIIARWALQAMSVSRAIREPRATRFDRQTRRTE